MTFGWGIAGKSHPSIQGVMKEGFRVLCRAFFARKKKSKDLFFLRFDQCELTFGLALHITQSELKSTRYGMVWVWPLSPTN